MQYMIKAPGCYVSVTCFQLSVRIFITSTMHVSEHNNVL
jgi:hypothetical protein